MPSVLLECLPTTSYCLWLHLANVGTLHLPSACSGAKIVISAISRDPSRTDDGGWHMRLSGLPACFWRYRSPQGRLAISTLHTHLRHLFTPPARTASAVALRDSKMLSGSGEGSARCIQCVQGSSGGRRGGVGVAGEGPHMSHGPVCHVPGPIASLEGGSGGPKYFSSPPSLGRAGEKKS